MSTYNLLVPIVFVASLPSLACAEWASDWATGCKVELPVKPAFDDVSWNGACKEGLATGHGTLRGTNATRIEGEFDNGRPITASGQYVVVRDGGARELIRVSYRKGIATIQPATEKPGRSRIELAPLVGSWEWRGQDGGCTQTREFLANGESVVRESTFTFSQLVQLYSLDGLPGWMELEGVTIGRYSLRNCSGKTAARDGDTEQMYLRFDDKGKLSACTAPDEKTCFVAAVRSGTSTESASAQSGSAGSTRQLITSQAGRSSGGINTANLAHGFGGGAVSGVVTNCGVKSSELHAPGLEALLCTRIRLIRFGARDAPAKFEKRIDFFAA